MKYYVVAGIVVLSGVIATLVAHQKPSEYSEAKRNAIEPQSASRPAYFQDMLFKPGAEVRMRGPASVDGK